MRGAKKQKQADPKRIASEPQATSKCPVVQTVPYECMKLLTDWSQYIDNKQAKKQQTNLLTNNITLHCFNFNFNLLIFVNTYVKYPTEDSIMIAILI